MNVAVDISAASGHSGPASNLRCACDVAATTSGVQAGLCLTETLVIGINFAVLRDFGGSNLAVVARYTTEHLKWL